MCLIIIFLNFFQHCDTFSYANTYEDVNMDVTVRKIEMFFFCRSLNQGDWSPLGAKGWLGGKECQRLRFQDFILVEHVVKVMLLTLLPYSSTLWPSNSFILRQDSK